MSNTLYFIYSTFLWFYIFFFFVLTPIFAVPFSLVFGWQKSFRIFFKLFVRFFFFIFRLSADIKGLENIPKDKNVILLSSHVSFIDPFFLNSILPGWYNFVVFARVLFNPIAMVTMRGCGFVIRQYGHYLVGSRTILNAVKSINKGENFILFPTENVVYDGTIPRVSKSIYKVMAMTDTVILPVYLNGVMKQVFLQKPFKAKVVIGSPMDKAAVLLGRKTIKEAIESLSR